MKIIKNKKGAYEADTTPFYIIFGIIVSVLFILFVFIVSNYSTDAATPPEGLEEYLQVQRFLRSPDCFTYEDIAGRTYPLIFDWEKFTQARLTTCFITKGLTNINAFRLRLSFDQGNKNIQTDNWDDESNLDKSEAPKKVFVYFNNQIYEGQFTLGVQYE